MSLGIEYRKFYQKEERESLKNITTKYVYRQIES